ncbi:MAG: peptidoglycan/LPS O-acetylase OafA/YrhL [Ilumatobacter sp.]
MSETGSTLVEARSADDGSPRGHLEYRPALDGLRGVAVAAVVAFHLGHLQGGFLGVDMFFTLSGYLITRLLLAEHETSGTVSFAAFWSRRAWRLFPALYALLAVLCVYAAFVASPVELDDLRGAGIASLLFVANWWFIARDAGYWDQFVAPSPLEHVWSLAIEQQFYVVWPLVVAVALRCGRKANGLLAVTAALVGASTIWLAVLSRSDVSRAYFGSGSRSGSILVGAALAILIHRQDRWLIEATRSRVGPWAAGAAGTALAVAWVAINGETDTWFYLGGYLAHAVAVSMIIAVLTFRTTGRVVQVLESPPLRRLGVISYGLYLWHWPVIVILDAERTGLDGTALLATRLAVSLLLTEISYRLIEVPTRRRFAGKVHALIVFPLAAALIGAALFASTRASSSESFSSAPPPPAPASLAPTSILPSTSEPAPDSASLEQATSTSAARATTTTSISVDGDSVPALLVTTPAVLPSLRVPTEAEPLRVLLVGDSYMYDAQPGIEAALGAMHVDVVGAAQLGFTITSGEWEDSLRSLVAEHEPDLIVSMWARFDVEWLSSHEQVEYEQRLDTAVELLTADNAALGFIGLAPSLTAGVDREPVDRAINVIFADLPNRHDRAFYIDPDPIVAPDGLPVRRIETLEGDLLVRKVDVSHYCSDGAARFGLALSELVNELAAAPVADPATWWLTEWRTDERYDDPSGSCR